MTETQQIPKPQEEPKEELKTETKKEIIEDIKESGVPEEVAKKEEALDEKASAKKPEEKKKEEVVKEDIKKVERKSKIKKTKAVVNAISVPISTKYSIAICKFIKNKSIDRAIKELEQVLSMKRAIPMKGEIPHRKGNMMSGRFPQRATTSFVKILKNLNGNANANELDEPIISEAIANIASRPYGKFGRVRKKRTHIKIIVSEKKIMKKLNKKQTEKKKTKNGRKKHS